MSTQRRTTRRRRTIGEDPLDALVPPPSEPNPEGTPRRASKVRATFHLPDDVLEGARNAVYWTPGLTLAGLAESALREALRKLEADRGKPFPPREAELQGGRPVGARQVA